MAGRALAATAALLMLAARGAGAATPEYVIHDLGAFGGASAIAEDINNAGLIVVKVTTDFPNNKVVLWSGTAMELGPGVGRAINDSGAIVGWSNGEPRALLWDPSAHDLGPGYAYAINGSGHIVGQSVPTYHAFLAMDGAITQLATPEGDESRAEDINDRGEIAGWIAHGNTRRAVIWRNGVAHDLGSLGGPSVATAISNAGVAVGTAVVVGEHGEFTDHAFIWDGDLRDLGLGTANDINRDALVVGQSGTRPAAWSAGGLVLLPGLTADNSGIAVAVNDAGFIAGWAAASDGTARAVYWEPVPEPAASVCLSAGLLSCAAFRRCGRRGRRA